MDSKIKMNLMKGIVFLIAIGIGLLVGYFIFGNNQSSQTIAQVHNHEPDANQTNTETEIWTCSMHPQIRQPEPGLCPICEMDLIPAGTNQSNDPLVLQMTESAVSLANIQTTKLGESAGENGKTIPLSGKIQADERLAFSQVAHVPGRIEKLFVSFTGEQVYKGQGDE